MRVEAQGGNWLADLIEDARERQRSWRLSCIRAEAELRALGKQASGGSPRRSGSEGEDQEGRPPENEAETLSLLSHALALERHTEELEAWKERLAQEVDLERERGEYLEARCLQEQEQIEELTHEADNVAAQAGDLLILLREMRQAHEARCREILGEDPDVTAMPLPLGDLADAVEESRDAAAKAVVEAEFAMEERERLWMRREEAQTRRWDLIDVHAQSLREISWAKRAMQARVATLGRLQGNLSRARARGDRQRRQLEGQLAQCRADLADALARADAQGEQLRKAKQQQGRQLRLLREATGDLQQEVDAHLQFMEAADSELRAFRAEEQELELNFRRHAERERLLEHQAAALQAEADQLCPELAAEDRKCQEVRLKLLALQEECASEAEACRAAEAATAEQQQRLGEVEAAAHSARAELQEEERQCSRHSAEVARLRACTEEAQAARARRNHLVEEKLQAQDGVEQILASSRKHAAEMQEAVRRVARLRDAHKDLTEMLKPGGGLKALAGSAEQAIGRASKKAEALLTLLEAARKPGGVAGAGAGGVDGAPGLVGSAARGLAALQRGLRAEAERSMEAALLEQRKRYLLEQQKAAEDAMHRADEMASARRERRTLEDELSQKRRECVSETERLQSEGQAWQAQLVILDKEAALGAQALAAEFSDLLQKQALEKEELLRQIEELRHGTAGDTADEEPDPAAGAAATGAAASGGEPLSPKALAALRERLAVAEAEAEQLGTEREELHQARVRLKAAVVAAKLRSGGSAPGRPLLEPLAVPSPQLGLAPLSARSCFSTASAAAAGGSGLPGHATRGAREVPPDCPSSSPPGSIRSAASGSAAAPGILAASGGQASEAHKLHHHRSLTNGSVTSTPASGTVPAPAAASHVGRSGSVGSAASTLSTSGSQQTLSLGGGGGAARAPTPVGSSAAGRPVSPPVVNRGTALAGPTGAVTLGARPGTPGQMIRTVPPGVLPSPLPLHPQPPQPQPQQHQQVLQQQFSLLQLQQRGGSTVHTWPHQ